MRGWVPPRRRGIRRRRSERRFGRFEGNSWRSGRARRLEPTAEEGEEEGEVAEYRLVKGRTRDPKRPGGENHRKIIKCLCAPKLGPIGANRRITTRDFLPFPRITISGLPPWHVPGPCQVDCAYPRPRGERVGRSVDGEQHIADLGVAGVLARVHRGSAQDPRRARPVHVARVFPRRADHHRGDIRTRAQGRVRQG